jgi:hypothetical protein
VIDYLGRPVDASTLMRVKEGVSIKIYESRSRHTRHACIGGRATPEDAALGLHVAADFDATNYELISSYKAKST